MHKLSDAQYRLMSRVIFYGPVPVRNTRTALLLIKRGYLTIDTAFNIYYATKAGKEAANVCFNKRNEV